jgi:hypothetical protein
MLTFKGVLYPVYFGIGIDGLCDSNDIEAGRDRMMDPVFLQVEFGAAIQFSLLAGIDTAGTVYQAVALPVSDLDKNNRCILLHDQINLTIATMIVFGQQSQTLLFEKMAGQFLGKLSLFLSVTQS